MNRIKYFRKQVYLTQEELAKKSGVSLASISAYERGIRNPKIENLRKLANVLRTQPLFLEDSNEA
ncbi:Transcriptional regulator [Fructobacillus fructosus]|uniref:helix-turn-helix domain-containing protein n=1 Tax=Fructobacillus TaxID=559173 RepID=UPI0019428B86|nr:helix-turn-helix transcriptional regulator [Fructobacillus tropaeoli]GIC69597.1 helix-turn-helix transcriptional regulator [Fructobacillus tropaeoli]CAK1234308.1 Transcriptional regulator [Fructobacillus fructosus]